MDPIDIDGITSDTYAGPFHARQAAAGADFYEDLGSLWTRSFGDAVAEYWSVRRDVALWDVSALAKYRFTGPDTLAVLERLTTRRMIGTRPGTVRYGITLNEQGRMLDEATSLVVSPQEAYYFGNDEREPFLEHLDRVMHGLDVRVENATREMPNVAIQGPGSYQLLSDLTDADIADLKWFRFIPEPITLAGVRGMLVRAGFTGELGYEFYLDGPGGAERVWDAIAGAGATLIGLDAIELLRIEAGLAIMEEDYFPGETDPYDLSLDAFIELEGHDFVGQEAAAATAASPPRRFVTLAFDEGGAPEPGTPVVKEGAKAGDVRSAAVTPRFGPIALSVVTAAVATEGGILEVGGRAASLHGVPIDDPGKERPRSNPRAPLRAV